MEAMKEQIATMMEAMTSMKKIMEANAVIAAATSAVAKVNSMPPSSLNQMNHPTLAMVGKDLGSTNGLHVGLHLLLHLLCFTHYSSSSTGSVRAP